METITIEIKNPKARKLLENLADLNLITIKKNNSWLSDWKALVGELPNAEEITENMVIEEISKYRQEKNEDNN